MAVNLRGKQVVHLATVSVAGAATCLVLASAAIAATIVGDDSNNTLNGTAAADWMYGKDGDDWINGKDTGDNLFGDAGRDSVFGGAGNDTIYGGSGDDGHQCEGANGASPFPPPCALEGGQGPDNVYGGPGSDFIVGQQAADALYGNDDGYQDFIYAWGDGTVDHVVGGSADWCYTDPYDLVSGCLFVINP